MCSFSQDLLAWRWTLLPVWRGGPEQRLAQTQQSDTGGSLKAFAAIPPQPLNLVDVSKSGTPASHPASQYVTLQQPPLDNGEGLIKCLPTFTQHLYKSDFNIADTANNNGREEVTTAKQNVVRWRHWTAYDPPLGLDPLLQNALHIHQVRALTGFAGQVSWTGFYGTSLILMLAEGVCNTKIHLCDGLALI